MTTQTREAKDQYLFRGTDKQKGRNVAVTPQNSSMKHLGYARIILDSEQPNADFETAEREIGLICLAGECTIEAARETNDLRQYDSIYIPRDSRVRISTASRVD